MTVEHMGERPIGDLKETKICEYGRACKFKATLHSAMKEHAESARGRGKKKSTGMPTTAIFEVTSQCGSKTHEFFRLDILKFRDAHKSGTSKEYTNYPVFFDSSHKTGKIDKFYYSKHDGTQVRNTKHGILEALSKRIHPDALTKAKSSPKKYATTYLFEGTDRAGHFRAHHTVSGDGEGNVLLTENVMYTKTSGSQYADDSPTKRVGTGEHGAPGAFKQTKKSQAKVGGEGHVHDLHQKDKLSMGTKKPEGEKNSANKPEMESPSPGQTKASCGTKVKRAGFRKVNSKCRKESEDPNKEATEFMENLELALGGRDAVMSRGFREPLTQDELGVSEDGVGVDPKAMLAEGHKLLAHGKFTMSQLVKVMHPRTVVPLMASAKAMYKRNQLSLAEMKAVLAAASSVRSDGAYREVLSVFLEPKLDLELREQAMVSLLRDAREPNVPWFVAQHVATVAHMPQDPLSHGATLLLGALLRDHLEKEDTNHHIDKLVNELDHLDPNNVLTAQRACSILGALENFGATDAMAGLAVRRFANSPITRVRRAAQACQHIFAAMAESDLEGNPHVQKVYHGPWKLAEVDGDMDGPTFDDQNDPNEIVLKDAMSDIQATPEDIEEEGLEDGIPDEDGYRLPFWAPPSLMDLRAAALGEQLDDTTSLLAYPGSVEDGDKRGQGVGAPGGPVHKKGLIEYQWIIAGNKDFYVKAKINAGAEWGRHRVGGFGMGMCEVRIYFFKINLVQGDFKAGVAPASGAKGAEGVMELVFKFVGATVFSKQFSLPKTDGVTFGGECPDNWFDAVEAAEVKSKEWFKVFFKVKLMFAIGPVPVSVTISLQGQLGWDLAFGGWFKCTTSASMANTDAVSEGNANSNSFMGGMAIRGKVDLLIQAGVDVGAAKVGIEGEFTIFKGIVPAYSIVDNSLACAKIDLKWWALEGKINIFVELYTQKWTKTILKWKGPKQFKNVWERCYGPLVDGNFLGHPDTSAKGG